jgi:hypothetical protein
VESTAIAPLPDAAGTTRASFELRKTNQGNMNGEPLVPVAALLV